MPRKFLKGFWTGFWSPKEAGKLLGQNPRLLLWCLIPVVLNYLVFGTIAYLASRFIPEITDAFLPEATNWLFSLLRFLFQGVGYLLVGLVSYFLFVPVAGLIASPFNDMLAEQVQILLTGTTPEGAGWKNFLSDALFALKVELKKLILLAALLAGVFLIGIIPVAQIISPVLGVLVGVFFVSLEYMDFAMAHRRLPFGDRLGALVSDHPGLTLGFGIPPYLVALIPVLNVLLIPLLAPVLVVAGAIVYHEHLAPGREKKDAGGASG